jgi:hypothetical protein
MYFPPGCCGHGGVRARVDGAGCAETAASLRPLRRPLAVPLSRGTRQGDARRCRVVCLQSLSTAKDHAPALATPRKAARPEVTSVAAGPPHCNLLLRCRSKAFPIHFHPKMEPGILFPGIGCVTGLTPSPLGSGSIFVGLPSLQTSSRALRARTLVFTFCLRLGPGGWEALQRSSRRSAPASAARF